MGYLMWLEATRWEQCGTPYTTQCLLPKKIRRPAVTPKYLYCAGSFSDQNKALARRRLLIHHVIRVPRNMSHSPHSKRPPSTKTATLAHERIGIPIRSLSKWAYSVFETPIYYCIYYSIPGFGTYYSSWNFSGII